MKPLIQRLRLLLNWGRKFTHWCMFLADDLWVYQLSLIHMDEFPSSIFMIYEFFPSGAKFSYKEFLWCQQFCFIFPLNRMASSNSSLVDFKCHARAQCSLYLCSITTELRRNEVGAWSMCCNREMYEKCWMFTEEAQFLWRKHAVEMKIFHHLFWMFHGFPAHRKGRNLFNKLIHWLLTVDFSLNFRPQWLFICKIC